MEMGKGQRSKTAFEGVIDSSDVSILPTILDISTTGILCVSFTELPETIAVELTIELPTAMTQYFHVIAEVIRCYPDSETPGQYRVACSFTDIGQAAHDSITNYVAVDGDD
jgi:c-di-GMP-binding flagellar brake protein YcgR